MWICDFGLGKDLERHWIGAVRFWTDFGRILGEILDEILDEISNEFLDDFGRFWTKFWTKFRMTFGMILVEFAEGMPAKIRLW